MVLAGRGVSLGGRGVGYGLGALRVLRSERETVHRRIGIALAGSSGLAPGVAGWAASESV